MTLEELEANSRQIRSSISEALEWKPRDSHGQDLTMRGISLLLEGLSSLNSRLDEIETRLSTCMLGLEKLNEKHETMPGLVTSTKNGHPYPFSL
jgi:hypothetical protein